MAVRTLGMLAAVMAVGAMGSFVSPARFQVNAPWRQRCPVPVAAASAEEPLEQTKKRTFEFCELDENGEIEECAVVAEEELPALLGFEEAARVLNDPMSSELFFGRKESLSDDASESGDAEEKFTLAEWSVRIDDVPEDVPEDVLLKTLGPDALGLKEDSDDDAEPRFHVHFGAGRLGMGLVVPAISASGIPFAVVQRPKPKWMELFSAEGVTSNENEVSSSSSSRRHTTHPRPHIYMLGQNRPRARQQHFQAAAFRQPHAGFAAAAAAAADHHALHAL